MKKHFLKILGVVVCTFILAIWWAVTHSGSNLSTQKRNEQLIAEIGKVTELDIGTVVIDPKSTKHSLIVSLHNPTEKVIKLNDISTSCGCTGATLNEKTIQPLSTGKLNVKLSKASRGRRLFVITLSGGEIKTVIRLQGLVIVEHSWEPSSLAFAELKPNQKAVGQAIFNLVRSTNQNSILKVKQQKDAPSDLKVIGLDRVSKSINHEKFVLEQYKLSIEITPTQPGQFHSYIYILDPDSENQFEYYVRWTVPKPISVSPSQITFIGKKKQIKSCFIRTTDGQKLNLLKYHTNSSWFRIAEAIRINEKSQKLVLELLSDEIKGDSHLEGTLTLVFDHLKESEIPVPVKWFK